MAVRIDGKAVAAKVRGEIAEEVAALKKQGVQTGMAVVLVGEDPASKIYVRNKGKACAETGIYSEEHVLPENTTQEELLAQCQKGHRRCQRQRRRRQKPCHLYAGCYHAAPRL